MSDKLIKDLADIFQSLDAVDWTAKNLAEHAIEYLRPIIADEVLYSYILDVNPDIDEDSEDDMADLQLAIDSAVSVYLKWISGAKEG